MGAGQKEKGKNRGCRAAEFRHPAEADERHCATAPERKKTLEEKEKEAAVQPAVLRDEPRRHLCRKEGIAHRKMSTASFGQIAAATLVEKFDIEPKVLTPIFQPNEQTLEGSFSSASKPIFEPKYAFCSIFRELQELQSFAPLQFQKLRKILENFF